MPVSLLVNNLLAQTQLRNGEDLGGLQKVSGAEVKCAAHLTKAGEAECCSNHGETFLVSDVDTVPWKTFSMAAFEELFSSGLGP